MNPQRVALSVELGPRLVEVDPEEQSRAQAEDEDGLRDGSGPCKGLSSVVQGSQVEKQDKALLSAPPHPREGHPSQGVLGTKLASPS